MRSPETANTPHQTLSEDRESLQLRKPVFYSARARVKQRGHHLRDTEPVCVSLDCRSGRRFARQPVERAPVVGQRLRIEAKTECALRFGRWGMH